MSPEPTSFAEGDIAVEIGDDFVALALIRRPPHNYFDVGAHLGSLADAFEAAGRRPALPRDRALPPRARTSAPAHSSAAGPAKP